MGLILWLERVWTTPLAALLTALASELAVLQLLQM